MNEKEFERDVTVSHRRNYDNWRYPPNTTHYKNWISLTRNVKKYSIEDKTVHVRFIMIRRCEESSKKCSEFVKLLHQIRFFCILTAYFPHGSEYHKECDNISSHPGWQSEMTEREKKILDLMVSAMEDIKKDCKSTKTFDKADELFGHYRHDLWVASLSE